MEQPIILDSKVEQIISRSGSSVTYFILEGSQPKSLEMEKVKVQFRPSESSILGFYVG